MCKPDKSKGVVLVDRDAYIKSMSSTFNDSAKFEEIGMVMQKYTFKIEDSINNFLRKLKSMKLLFDEIYKKLFVSGSSPGVLYGLPKNP